MLDLALVWHQHQPCYKNLAHPTPAGSYHLPWVRLHARPEHDPAAQTILLKFRPDGAGP